MAMSNPNTDFDFGFSIVAENELDTAREKQLKSQNSTFAQNAVEAKDKLHTLYKMVMPLLENLKKDPEKDYILWPDRVKKIDTFIKKIELLVEEEIKQ